MLLLVTFGVQQVILQEIDTTDVEILPDKKIPLVPLSPAEDDPTDDDNPQKDDDNLGNFCLVLILVF